MTPPTQQDATFAEIFTPSSHPPHKHRAVAFKEQATGQWFVLDPYLPVLGGSLSTRPIPFDQYRTTIAVFQNPPRQIL